MQLTTSNKNSSLPKVIDHSDVDPASMQLSTLANPCSIDNTPKWRVADQLTKLDAARFDVCSLRNARTESSLAAISSGLSSFGPPTVKLNKPGIFVLQIATLCLKKFSSLWYSTHPTISVFLHICHP